MDEKTLERLLKITEMATLLNQALCCLVEQAREITQDEDLAADLVYGVIAPIHVVREMETEPRVAWRMK